MERHLWRFLIGLVLAAALVLPPEPGQAGEPSAPEPAATADPAPEQPRPTTLAPPTSDFAPLRPVRIADSRERLRIAGKIPAGSAIGISLAGQAGVPGDAVAAALNVTVTDADAPGFLTAFPCDSPVPLASNINFLPGSAVPNQVTLRLGTDGRRGDVCLFSSARTHVVVDVTGYYPAGSDFRPITPQRLADTRPGEPAATPKHKISGSGNILSVPVAAIAAGAKAAVLNVTVTGPELPGFVTVFPCGARVPLASSLNFAPGQDIANAVTVKTGADGNVCVFSSAPTHLVVDANGWFPAGSDLASIEPVRIVDSRPSELGGWAKGLVAAGRELAIPVIGLHSVPNSASTVLLNVTVTQPAGSGWAVVYPCEEPRPLASNLNFTTGLTVANAVASKVGANGAVCLFSSAATHVVVDLLGHYPGPPRAPRPGSTFVRAQTSQAVFAVEPGGSVLPVSQADIIAAGNPPITVYPVAAGTSYLRYPWSSSVFAVAPSGAGRVIGWPEWVALGTPLIRTDLPAGSVVKTSNSPSLYAVAPDGSYQLLTPGEYASLGSPAPREVIAAPGSRFVKTEAAAAVFALAPDGTTRHLTMSEYVSVGSPAVEILPWSPVRRAVAAADLWASHRTGCPVGPADLIRLEFPHWDFAGRLQSGAVIVAGAAVPTIEATMRSAFDAHFPLQEVTPVEKYRGADEASMAAGNTSAFNCRTVVGNPSKLSQHSFGNAIDINPAQNPYVTSSRVYPPGSDSYLNRGARRPGMLFAGEAIPGTLSRAGWYWGARWAHPDYHHFSSNGG